MAPSASSRAAVPGVLQQQHGGEPHDLGLGGKQPQQQPRQPDRLLAQGRAHMRLAAGRRIALVEDEVDHGRHGGEAFGALDGAGRLVGHARLRDAALGAGDALLHRRSR